jgi:LmbE family N-acetylglucosaminyl deacetylase
MAIFVEEDRVKYLVAWIGFSVLSAVVASQASAQFPPPAGTGPGLPETLEAIDSARVTTRILYIDAHPDDESAAILTYLARGLHADVALLSLTRGEGGQNDLGPEQAPQLGLVRTQELLAATRGYGVKLYFTRAKDFGFSKTPEETERIWGDAVLEDMVRVIRTFRPNIVINHFGGVHSGHGHHQTAGLWTPKAVQLAADPSAFHDDLAGKLPPWSGEGPQHPVQLLDLDRSDNPKGYVVPFDEISPLWGKSYRQIGLDAFANHRTQGISAFLGSPFLRRPIGLVPEGNNTAFDPKSLAAPLRSILPGCRALEEADDELASARTAAQNLDWSAATSSLVLAANNAAHWMDKCPWHLTGDLAQEYQIADVNRPVARIEKALGLAAGLQLTGEADRSELVIGESFGVRAQAVCRREADCKMDETGLVSRADVKEVKREGDIDKGLQFTVELRPESRVEPSENLSSTESIRLKGLNQITPNINDLLPELPPLVSVRQDMSIDGHKFRFTVPVTHIQATSTRVDRVPLRLVPAYTLAVEPKQAIEVLAKPRKPFDVLLRVHSYATKPGKVNVGLNVPNGWTASSPVSLEFPGAGDRYARLTVTPSPQLVAGKYEISAYAQVGIEGNRAQNNGDDPKFTESLEPLPTLPTQLWSEPAQCLVHAFEINVPDNLHVGYITAESEPIPEALEWLGVRVEMLDAAALAFGDLSHLDAIVVGVRAYELRSDLPGANQRLLEYVSNGGTLVVQYQRDFAWNRYTYAPYPAKIGGSGPGGPLPRVTDENSPVKFLQPNDNLLRSPNKITQTDFKGWVQERGLYFWTEFAPKYTALLAMNDPGESEQKGALVYTRCSKGTYIYTGIAFFRQLPEGVPGAYRLFVNLLSASRVSH